MDSCLGVEQDLDKAISKFNGLDDHADKVISAAIEHIENLRKEIAEIPPDRPLTHGQTLIVRETLQQCKDTIQRLASEHRDLHASVSRVGKSIDRHFIADYAAVAPRAEQFCVDNNKQLMEQAIAQHLYRQGLESTADCLVTEAGLDSAGVERAEPFAELQRVAAALAAGDTAPALQWLADHADSLQHSPLPFTLHRMHFFKVGREQGAMAAVQYARATFPALAVRHERGVRAALCALAWVRGCTAAPPPQYARLLDERALAAATAETLVREACALLRLAPLSPLAAAVLAGCRALPALHRVRDTVPHPRVLAAWADDHLPLEVDASEEGGGYHSVFACPILRQQASDQNPPMRLLCGHVISRDALNKLAQGVKLKCPYCPMEQSPSEARQIYFA